MLNIVERKKGRTAEIQYINRINLLVLGHMGSDG